MEKYQQQMADIINSSTAKFVTTTARQSGKSLYHQILDSKLLNLPRFVVLEDHWEHLDQVRVDVMLEIAEWIEQQDKLCWKMDANTGIYYRYSLTPELLTLLQLRWS
jgi:hypothetical protein